MAESSEPEVTPWGAVVKHVMMLQSGYMTDIREGRKTVEGRVDSGNLQQVQAGDIIAFKVNAKSGVPKQKTCVDKEYVYVNKTMLFPTFRDMLEHYGVQRCLPHFKDDEFERGAKLYLKFPGHKDGEPEKGARAFEICLVDSKTGVVKYPPGTKPKEGFPSKLKGGPNLREHAWVSKRELALRGPSPPSRKKRRKKRNLADDEEDDLLATTTEEEGIFLTISRTH